MRCAVIERRISLKKKKLPHFHPSLKIISASALLLAVSACGFGQTAECRSTALIAQGDSAPIDGESICPNTRILSYNQQIFEKQSVYERVVNAPAPEASDKKEPAAAATTTPAPASSGKKS